MRGLDLTGLHGVSSAITCSTEQVNTKEIDTLRDALSL